MAATVTAVLHWSKELTTFGFQLRALDTGEHVVYKLTKHTPADMCYEIEIGDHLTHIDGTDLHGLTTRDVLKRIRIAKDKITLTLKKDEGIKRTVYSMIRENSPDRELPVQPRQPPADIEVVLHQTGEERTLGFVLQCTDLLDHVVSHVADNTPASGKMEVGDVLISINSMDTQKMSLRNVLIYLGRVTFPVKLKLKRDPWIKNYVREQFSGDGKKGEESRIPKHSVPKTLGSPPQSPKVHSPTSQQLAQPKIANAFSTADSGMAPFGKGTVRECVSESAARKSRIPQAITNSWSAPQSPSRGRKPVRVSQIPTAKADVKVSRFVITGQSQFQLSREQEDTTTLLKQHQHQQQHQQQQQQQIADNSTRNAPLVQYDTLSSSTSRSEDISASSCLLDDNSNANDAQPGRRQNLGPAHDKLGGCVFPVGSNTVPFHQEGENQERSGCAWEQRAGVGEENQNQHNCDSATNQQPDVVGSGHHHQPQQHSLDQSYSVPTSPTGYTVAAAGSAPKGVISLPTSPDASTGAAADQPQDTFRYRAAPGTLADASANAGSIASSGELTANSNLSSGSLGEGPPVRKCDAAGFRTSRSEDHLQQSQRDGGIGAIVAVDIDEDQYSSLNTLLDTQHDSPEQPISDRERFLWTYNMQPPPKPHATTGQPPVGGTGATPLSFSSSVSSSPQRSASNSPASPTSVSSSVMSSSGGSRDHSHAGQIVVGKVGNVATGGSNPQAAGDVAAANAYSNHLGHQPVQLQQHPSHAGQQHGAALGASQSHGQHHGGNTHSIGAGGDHSVSEAVSNLSSPDYQDEHDLLSSKDLMAMAISDHSDSDSTILVSETTHRFDLPLAGAAGGAELPADHKLIIEVKPDEASNDQNGSGLDDVSAELQEHQQQQQQQQQLQQQQPPLMLGQIKRDASPPILDDGSDVESLHSFRISPKKKVDRPSAERLARRLFYQEGFTKSDICRHLSKNNEFTEVLGDEYLKHYDFTNMTLDVALRTFVKEVPLVGETQERERVMYHFAKRYYNNNPNVFNSVDATHVLVSALLILNSDLHGEIQFHRTFSTFAKRLKFENCGEHFSKELLKHLFTSIKERRLEPAKNDDKKRGTENDDGSNGGDHAGSLQGPPVGPNPFLEAPRIIAAIEFKKGYVVRKSCYETNHKRTPFGRRSWKMFYCTLRDLVLYLHNDEHGFKRNQVSDNVYNGIRIHHALATRATDYNKRNHVFRLQTADQSEFLFQTSDSKELQSWIDTINYVCATFSAPPLEGAVGSQKRFQRPLLPCSSTKLSMREQLASHQAQYDKLCRMLEEHKESGPPSKGLSLQNYKEKDYYLQYELRRYKTYCTLLLSRLTLEPQDFGNQHTVSAAALNETSLDDEIGDDDGHDDDDQDDELLSLPTPHHTGNLLSHHRFQALQATKRPATR